MNQYSVQAKRHSGPGPRLLPGIEGFYVLSSDGMLGRYELDGRFSEASWLSARLADQTAALRRRYQDQDSASATLALIVRKKTGREWQSASLVFSDRVLGEIYRTGNEPGAPLTAFQRRHKTQSVYRGMDLLLNTRQRSDPQQAQFCPLLVTPAASAELLSQRYGVDDLDTVNALEVLDLLAPLDPATRRDPVLAQLRMDMVRAGIDPRRRRGADMKLVEEHAAPAPAVSEPPVARAGPWPDEEDRWQGGGAVREDHAPEYLPPLPRVTLGHGDALCAALLGWFMPFNELSDAMRESLAARLRISRSRAGSILIEQGSQDDRTLLLVDGALEVEAFDGRVTTIEAGTRRARQPISQLRPHAGTVRAQSDVSVSEVSQGTLRELYRLAATGRRRSGIEVYESDVLPGAGGTNP